MSVLDTKLQFFPTTLLKRELICYVTLEVYQYNMYNCMKRYTEYIIYCNIHV
jgi:hypothetical protein